MKSSRVQQRTKRKTLGNEIFFFSFSFLFSPCKWTFRVVVDFAIPTTMILYTIKIHDFSFFLFSYDQKEETDCIIYRVVHS